MSLGAVVLKPRDFQYKRYKAFIEYIGYSVIKYRYYSTVFEGKRRTAYRLTSHLDQGGMREGDYTNRAQK